MNYENSLEAAKKYDQEDELRSFRDEFNHPKDTLYFAGHSLGLMPKMTEEYINIELDSWKKYAVEGHFKGPNPWLPYHENLTEKMAKIVGAKNSEVVVMNSLTVNLHLMMISFYRPTKERFKILIEPHAFPSDQYAVDSQAKLHGFDPKEAVIEFSHNEDGTSSESDILDIIEKNKDSLALIMLGNVNYLSGQLFDFEKITQKAHEYGIMVGFNLAHGAGNLLLELNKWGVDFAVWCSYKYLNSGPGGIAGAFVHENHHKRKDIKRLEGWWGHNKKRRFLMERGFDPIESVESWQLSNPPIFQMASLRASLDIFDRASMKSLRKKGDHLTGFLEFLLKENCKESVDVVTPKERGSMLCLRFKKDPKNLLEEFQNKEVICDFREPDILRMTPIPLYNSYEDVFRLVKIIQENS